MANPLTLYFNGPSMKLSPQILTPTANPEWMGEEDSLIEETAKEGEAGTSVDSKSEQHAATSAANGVSASFTSFHQQSYFSIFLHFVDALNLNFQAQNWGTTETGGEKTGHSRNVIPNYIDYTNLIQGN